MKIEKERYPFGKNTCDKCGCEYSSMSYNVEYKINRNIIKANTLVVEDEWLEITCGNCQYKWETDCKDVRH